VDEKRRTRRKAARPGEILAAGLALFAERGFAATRLEDVAAAAGVAKGTIYLYFPSKEALFEAALRDRLSGAVAAADAAAREADGGLEAEMAAFLGAIYARLFEGDAPVLLKILVADGSRFAPLVALYRDLVIDRGLAAIRLMLDRAAARGELRLPAEAVDPRQVVAPALVAALWRLLFGDAELSRDAYAAGHVDLLMRGLLADRRPPPG
jgi:AcrR family transcriptional regulator